MRERWVEAPRFGGNQELSGKLHLSPMTIRLIRNRAGMSEQEVDAYLHGTLEDLSDALLMKGMREAAALLREKVSSAAAIRILGDYDIDGVNATYILLTALQRLGARVDTVIPDRLRDGYGINEHLISQAKEAGIDTIITCDNGIAAAAEIAFAKSLGMTVIVTDHHEVPYREEADGSRTPILPPADVIVNPKQADCAYPFKKLCGAAVAWRLVEVLYRESGIPREEYLALTQFAAVATIGDIMELTGENRTIVRYGLEQLARTENAGYRALIAVNDLADKKLNAYHIGFVIGPCINASGRLDTAKRALELLKAKTDREAARLAGDLKALNENRKDMTARGVEEAVRSIEESSLKQDRVLVVYLPDCHESLAGIIAGRIRERYYRPCLVLTDAEEGVKGSGRSIPAWNMFEELSRVKDLFTKFGGHPMAAGLSLPRENVENFRRRVNENCRLTEEELQPVITYDAILPLRYVGEQLMRELELMEPFGNGNERVLFAAGGLRVRSARILGRNRNVLKLVLEEAGETRMEALCFDEVEEQLAYVESHDSISILYYPAWNEFQGRRSIQLMIKAIR